MIIFRCRSISIPITQPLYLTSSHSLCVNHNINIKRLFKPNSHQSFREHIIRKILIIAKDTQGFTLSAPHTWATIWLNGLLLSLLLFGPLLSISTLIHHKPLDKQIRIRIRIRNRCTAQYPWFALGRGWPWARRGSRGRPAGAGPTPTTTSLTRWW